MWSPDRFGLLLLVALTTQALHGASAAPDARVSELIKLRNESPHGIISLDDKSFNKFADASARPYSLVIFWNAAAMRESANVRLKELYDNFKLYTVHARNKMKSGSLRDAETKLFFVELEVANSRDILNRMGINSVPAVLHISPTNTRKTSGAWNIPKSAKMKHEDYSSYPWTPQDFSAFVTQRTGFDFGVVHMPSALNHPVVLSSGLVAMLPMAFLAWKVFHSDFVKHPLLWSAAVMAVFMFATSGGLHNIIRGVPMVRMHPNGKVEWFLRGSGQLGFEGFTVGAMYIFFALCCHGLLVVPKYLGNSIYARPVGYMLLVMASMAVSRIIAFYDWKIGYRWRFYLGEWLASK